MWDSSNRASTRTARRFSSRRRSAFEQAGYAVVIADHYNEGARRDVHAEPLTNRQGWEACQSAHFWKAIHATACGVPHLVDFALRTCADAAHHPPTNGVDSLSPYTHPPIHHPSVPLPACLSICWPLSIYAGTAMGRASSPTANRWAATASSPVCYTTWLGWYLVSVRVSASSPVCYTTLVVPG